MKLDDYIQKRKRDWERLKTLVQRAESGQIRALSEAELAEFGQLYRAATSDLALAQRDYPTHPLAQYLNQLVGRAHPIVYRGEPLRWRQLVDFYLRVLPQLYRELWPFVLASALLFFVPAILIYPVMLLSPESGKYLFSPAWIARIKQGTEWWKNLNEFNEIGAGLIMTNNLRVSFFAYAGGMTLGLLTLYTLTTNGLQLGAIFGLLHYYGHAAPLWEFVVGHGVLELSEIVMSGAAGLMLGYALLRPGLLSRRDALVVAGQKSIRLLLGSAPLLVAAGLIEGLISPSDGIPAWAKFSIGIASGVLLYGYLFFAGHPRKQKFGSAS